MFGHLSCLNGYDEKVFNELGFSRVFILLNVSWLNAIIIKHFSGYYSSMATLIVEDFYITIYHIKSSK